MYRFLLAACLSASAAVALADLPAPTVVKINERVYALLGPVALPDAENQGYMVNSTAIIGDTGVILVDTGFTDAIGRHLKAAVAELTSKPITRVINTHHHGDHSLGNVVFEGAEIISAEKCRELVETTGHEWVDVIQSMTGMQFPGTKPVPATVTFAEQTRTERVIDGIKLVFWAPKGSHTAGDLMVYLPDDKVLIAGDILVQEITPNFRDANVKNWVETLEELSKLDGVTVVPGHGAIMRQADVAAMYQRMAALYAAVQKGYDEGLSDFEIRDTLDLSEWQTLKHFDEIMGINISRTFLEVEQASF